MPPAAPLPALLQTLACRRWLFAYLEKCRSRYGDRFTVYPVDMSPLVFLSDPRDIRAVLTAPPDVLHPGAGGALMAPLFGESSFVLQEQDEHLNGRNAIVPALRLQAVQAHAGAIAEIAEAEITSWPLDTPFPLDTRLQQLTMKVILTATVGSDDAGCEALDQRLLGMLAVMASLVLQEPRLRYLPGWHKTWERFGRHRHEVDERIFALIDRRRHAERPREDLLELLLAARNLDGSPMSDRQICDHLVSVIIAGHETTAATLAWAFQLLAHNRSVQDRLIEEIDNGSDDEYMNATVQETLRHKPVFVFASPRVVVKPIEIGGWTYEPPAQLLGCTYLMHHDPDLYPDPQAFLPERFLGETPRAGTWLPWGAGHKRCPGRHLALLEIQTVLREALSTRLLLPASTHIERPRWRSAILAPHAGSKVILRKRGPEPASRAGPVRSARCGAGVRGDAQNHNP